MDSAVLSLALFLALWLFGCMLCMREIHKAFIL